MKAAARALPGFLTEHKGLSCDDAYSLMSVAADFGVTQVVDQRQGIHAMIAKNLYPVTPESRIGKPAYVGSVLRYRTYRISMWKWISDQFLFLSPLRFQVAWRFSPCRPG
ncbi:MAG: hypothetical protein EXR28_09115 [Betaproteobacteria bacterium]|nr:hypothetical protein [Betaproteobacteria bacterium]